jgi:hypothetical protein
LNLLLATYDIYYKRSLDGGMTWQPNSRLIVADNASNLSSIAVSELFSSDWKRDNGIYVLWTDWRNKRPEIFFKRGWQIGALATNPNQGHNIARVVNREELNTIFQGQGAIFYQKLNRNGIPITTPVGFDQGKQPSIAITDAERSSSWICYTLRTEQTESLNCIIQKDDPQYQHNWKKFAVTGADSIFSPSLVLAIARASREDMGYVVYTKKAGNSTYIYFSAFDSLQERPYYTRIIDFGENDVAVLAPSISLTPGDLIHIVWQKTEQSGEVSRIYYITTLEPITSDDIRNGREPLWSEIIRISSPEWPQTEPASNPSVEAYGKYVYAAWRGPNEEGNPAFGDIWRRKRNINLPPEEWENPRNMSETGEQESNYPVMSTDFVTVWQESISGSNWDIWARFEPENSAQPIFETPTPSKYPHINGYWDPNPAVPPTFCVNTIWTEEFAPELFEVKFDCYRYEYNPNPNKDVGLYYAVEIGDSTPSPFCSQRDGYLSYGQYKIDYGQQKLKYKLPYLHPGYYYDVRAIVYQQGQNNWSQRFDIDSSLMSTVTFEPNRPETIWIRLPQQSYKNDAKVKYDIKKMLGNRVVVADLRLYQKEEFVSSGNGSGPQSAGYISIPRPILYQSYPNPAKSVTRVRYSLPSAGKVSLQLFDISGKLIRTIVDEYQNAGSYSLEIGNWKLKIPSGVYFYRLKTDGFSDTKRLILVR